LVERLMHGATCPLTLISAPAGYGKTTLLSEWISNFNVAWLSLDEKDNDPMRFWTYLFSALETIQPGLTEHSLALLHAPQPPTAMSHGDENERIEPALTALINALAAHPMEFVLVLDDYHVIETPTIHTALTFLLDHLTPQAHLFIASRADPPLPLARLRARGQLVELRAADLCFTPDEAAVFLNEVMRLGLAPEDIAALEARTEGWIAGLQLAALAMQAPLATQGRDDISGFIAAFTGSNRYILDYLIEEVLRRQPASVQGFLLQTCILDHLCGSLCDAVLIERPAAGSQAMLEMLEQANLFTIPLDQDRRWYRYHRLFADFLQSRLRQTQPDRVPELHRRAAEWHEQNGFVAEAVDHALAAQDFERAGHLIEYMAETLLMRSEAVTLLNWLDALPDALVHSRPRLCVFHALAMVILGQLDAVEPHLQDAEKGIPPDDTSASVAEVRGQIAGLRAMLAAYQGDVPRVIELAHQALEHLSSENPFLRSMVAWLMGFAFYLDDDAEASRRAFTESIEISQATGNTLAALLSVHLLGYQQAMQGHLRQAAETYRQGLQFLNRVGASKPPFPIACLAYFGMGEILREENDLESAERYLTEGLEIGEPLKNSEWLVDGYISLAKLRLAQGDTDAALSLVQEIQQSLPEETFLWHKVYIETLQARLWMARGNLAAAVEWAIRQEHEPILRRKAGSMSFQVRAVKHPTLARLWIARRNFDQALELLRPLRQEAEAGHWMGIVIEALALEALALDGLSQHGQALVALSRALALSEPEGYVRIFVDEGAPMSALLTRMKAEGGTLRVKEYLDKLLSAFGKRVIQPSSLILHPLAEPLSQRELQVLRLIADGLTNQEIAEHLVVGKSTVKTHVNHIFSKLCTTSRRQAVARAQELGLL
jgi:LuxR family maltose regulon positive regulatory protein